MALLTRGVWDLAAKGKTATVSLGPEHIDGKRFLAAIRGYDRHEVDSFLRTVALEMRTVLERVKALEAEVLAAREEARAARAVADPYARLGDEVAGVLRSAMDAAAAMRTQAQAEADAILAAARTQADEEHRTARAALEQANAEAERVRGALMDELDDLRAEASGQAARSLQEARARRDELEEELREIRARVVVAARQLEQLAAGLPDAEVSASLAVAEADPPASARAQ